MFKDFPSLHPLAVHFPIVLILVAAVFQVVVTLKSWPQIRWATLFLMGGAFLSALAASTIFHADPSEDTPKAAMTIFEQHEKYAQYTLWMSGITLLLKGISDFYKINRRSFDVVLMTAAIVTLVFVSIAGHHGAQLTHIAGVGPMGRYLMKEHGGKEKDNDMKGMKDMKEKNSDSAMQKNDTMSGMKSMPGMDTMKNMKGMDKMKDMKNMKGKGDKKEMKNMKGMKSMKGMEGKKEMKNMEGMDPMKNMNRKEDMKDMKTMDNMDTMKNMKNMKGMEGKKDMKNMEGMDSMKNMKGMDMAGKNPMDTFHFQDNNPTWLKSKRKSKQ